MTEYARITVGVTKAQHDAVVAVKGRPFTDHHMRQTRQVDDDATDSGLSIIDQVIADHRRAVK